MNRAHRSRGKLPCFVDAGWVVVDAAAVSQLAVQVVEPTRCQLLQLDVTEAGHDPCYCTLVTGVSRRPDAVPHRRHPVFEEIGPEFQLGWIDERVGVQLDE